MKLKDILSPFSAWQNIVLEPVTVKDPLNERPGAARYRGFHQNDIEKCIGCGTCEEICENKAIDLVPDPNKEPEEGDSALRPMVDYGRCCWCALCVDVCPTGSLSMSNEYKWVSNDPEEFRYTPGIDKKEWDHHPEGWKKPVDYELYEPERVDMEEVAPEERSDSFIEIVRGYSREQAEKEADRCLECGLCRASCPNQMDIPGYIKAIREGDLETGLKIIYETNPFPEMCGRVCTHRCELVCPLSKNGKPLAIRWLKRFVADQIPFEDYKRILGAEHIKGNGKKVAIIGAGPSGLSAAYYLTTRGYKAVIFESKDKPGGMTMYGIPKYRLPQDKLEAEVKYLEEIGVEFRYNTRIGRDLLFEDLYNTYDALFIGIGFEVPYKLGISGEEARGSIQAIHFLNAINKGVQIDVGSRVVVIGGGNVAMDAARVSRRLGAEVTMLYRRRIVDMPADEEEITGAEEEGVHILAQTIPREIVVSDEQVSGITYLKAEMQDAGGGRPKPVPIEGSETTIPADTIIGAIGQEADFSLLPEAYREKLEVEGGRMKVGADMQTSIPRVFAGGDAVNRTADAISAIADGYKAVEGIDDLLMAAEK